MKKKFRNSTKAYVAKHKTIKTGDLVLWYPFEFSSYKIITQVKQSESWYVELYENKFRRMYIHKNDIAKVVTRAYPERLL